VHAVAHAPQEALGGRFLTTSWPDVAATLHVSAYSLKAALGCAAGRRGGTGDTLYTRSPDDLKGFEDLIDIVAV
jgi:enoyl-[acyl-carrier protein] reductase I